MMVLLPVSKSNNGTGMASDKSVKKATAISGPESPYKPSKVHLSSVNPYITCNLCKGYLIDATTIVECLHSFCHSCIMKHLRTEQYCPQCEMMIKPKPGIKPDATLQAIVYKLVPGLYERELLRKRAFYRQHPSQAILATPEQRGDDTEHLIFSTNDKIALTLEYADKELADNNEELERPKFLMCPAIFSIANLKKFIIYKYSIPTHLFYVEIMYKVQTITLPDHYTLMDVAYIYTWKKDAHMRFFYRIRTHEMKSVELPEVPLRRSPSISAGRTSSALAVIKEEESDGKESCCLEDQLIKPSDIKREEEQPSLVECDDKTSEATAAVAAAQTHQPAPVLLNGCHTAREPVVADVKPSIASLGKYQHQRQENRPVEGVVVGGQQQQHQPPKVKKNESIKLKIEMNKNTYVSILQSPQPDAGSKHHKAEKVKKKKSEDKDKCVNKIKSSSDLKIKIEKVKDGLVSSVKKDGKSSKKAPYKVEISGVGDLKNNNHKISSNDQEKKVKKESQKLDKSAKKVKSPKRSPDFDKVQPSIVLKIDQKSPELSTSTLKLVSTHPLASSSPKHKPDLTLEDEKSQFLNSFELTPIKSLQGLRSPPSSPGSSSCSPPSSSQSETKPAKRKNKDPASGRSVVKKPKLSDDEMKALVERTVQQNIKSTSELIAPVGSSKPPPKREQDKKPTIAPKVVVAPQTPTTVPVKSETISSTAEQLKKEPKLQPFEFKPPIMLPPPVVSTSNIPAPKPSQPVMIAPKPPSTDAPKRPAVPSFVKPLQPVKKLPPLLPKDLDYMKNKQKSLNDLKRSHSTLNSPFNISPNKDTEISQLKPEDVKKNVKVYGPPADVADNFAVPAALPSMPPKPKPNKNRPVNYRNFAMMNANKAPAGSRTPIPTYSNSPSYSPDSPQYNPNFNFSTNQYKYTSPLAYANFLQNMLNDHKSSNVSSPTEKKQQTEVANERKRPCPSPENKQHQPPEKQPKVQSLLNQINIPSSLSITLATEEDEAAREKARKSLPEDDKNYIEILKLPEISITEADRITPPKVHETSPKSASGKSPIPKPTADNANKSPSEAGKKSSPADNDNTSFQHSFIQSIKDKEKQRGSKQGTKPEKQQQPSPPPLFTPPASPAPNMNAFKLPNATVLSNGIVKLNSYPELDLINKNNPNPAAVGGGGRPSPSPPKSNTTSKHIPIAPKPTGTFFPPTGTPSIPLPNRKSMSPPVLSKQSVSPGQPKSKTPPIGHHPGSPAHAASLAAMGPMFGMQLKPEGSGYRPIKKAEPKPKKSTPKSSHKPPYALDLSPVAAATAATNKPKDQMNMLMMNNNLSNALTANYLNNAQMANYLTEMAKRNNPGMMLQTSPFQVMQACLQQYLMTHGASDNLEK